MLPHVYSDDEEAPRHPKRVPVPSAKVVSADNAADLELPSHRKAHIARRAASAALRPPSESCTQTSIADTLTEFEGDDELLISTKSNLKQLTKGKKRTRTPEDDTEDLSLTKGKKRVRTPTC
ncbi:hypothetical protein F4604DRAFT_1674525 [Suillus subluteus]|nr:hypothetical protein F4604DRAFT_1674525 [Suillus subluteus]